MGIALIAAGQEEQLPAIVGASLGKVGFAQEMAGAWVCAVRGDVIPEFSPAAQVSFRDAVYSLWLAEALARTGDRDRALFYLRNAVARGFVNVTFMEQRSRWLASLREDPEFKALMVEARVLQVSLLAELQVATPQSGR